MNLEEYRERRRRLAEQGPTYRNLCMTCFQPGFSCYCQHIRRFDPGIRFMILIHPIEVKRRIATGRMSHLCLEGSELIRGEDFSDSRAVNEVLADPGCHSVVLYPGREATDLSALAPMERGGLFPAEKKLAVFVLDGTWNTARKMMNRSRNLRELPRVCFTPSKPSTFRVRKQPQPGFYSTIEAIHETIELIGPARGFDTGARRHDALLHVFDKMVEKQLEFVREHRHSRHATSFKRLKAKGLA